MSEQRQSDKQKQPSTRQQHERPPTGLKLEARTSNLLAGELDLNEGQILLRPVDCGKHPQDSERPRSSSLLAAESKPQTLSQLKSHDRSSRGEDVSTPAANLGLPIVSIATCEDDGDQPTRPKRQQKKKEKKRLQLEARDQNDASSLSTPSSSRRASSTSDVNSYDDAESIASRLSQIVDEQEFLMIHQASDTAVKAALAQANIEQVGSMGAGHEATDWHKSGDLRARRPSSSLAVHHFVGRSPSPAQVSKTGRDDASSARQPEKARTKSFAGCALDKEATALRERRNESYGALCPPQGGGNQFLPERGDLRSLESIRQSQAAAVTNMNSEPDQRGDLMLNIRRSAWKLDEFEQAFKPPDSEASNDSGSPQMMPTDLESNGDSDKQRVPFECPSLFDSSINRNLLLIRTSKRNVFQSAGGKQSLGAGNELVAAQNSSNNLLLSPAALCKRRHSHAEVIYNQQHQQTPSSNNNQNKHLLDNFQSSACLQSLGKRRGSCVSMASFASSFDSYRSARRPFGRLGSLLSKPTSAHNKSHHSGGGGSGGGGDSRHNNHGRRFTTAGQAYEGGPTSTGNESSCCCSTTTVKQYMPVLEWLPAYEWRRDLWPDVTAGLAVAVLNISTSLAAAVVAETDLGVAFRSSIFNTFVYALLCTSRHSSFGSWSIMSQMLLDSVRRALSDELILNRINLGPQASWNAEEYETWHMNIIIMYTFLIGLVQLMAGLLNLGNILASFIPEALCSSMIAATAFTMAIGQLANMCGTSNKILWAIEKNTTVAWADLKNPPMSITDLFAGLFRWIQQIALLAKHYEQINTVAVLISAASLALLVLNQYYLQRKLRQWFNKENLFIPFEMVLLIMWICLAYALELRDHFHVATCGPIAIEFNLPSVPNLRLFRELWFDSLATALISYTMVFIMARTYSNKFNYEINSNQELIACGAGNLIGGLFDALPATASFSRTAGQVEAGGRTQMASLVNCFALVVLAQFLGHYVAHLPVCVMSATLFFGFVRMMTRAREAAAYWRLCKVDFAIWVFTFMAILTLDLVNGFVYGFIFSILTMLYRAQNRRCYMLGSIGSSDVYVPMAKYPLAHELEGIKIFQFCGPIHYVCADLFERLLRQKTRVNVKEILKEQQQIEQSQQQQKQPKELESGKSLTMRTTTTTTMTTTKLQTRDPNLPSHIILDFSMISFIDSAGIHVIKKIIDDHNRVHITIMLASLASHVAQVVKSEPSLWLAHKDRFYVTLADAVHHALHEIQAQQSIQVLNNGIGSNRPLNLNNNLNKSNH